MANIPFKTITFPGLANVYTVPEVDNTLQTSGKAADAKKTGDEISQLKADLDNLEPGLSNNAKIALLNCIAHVYWDDDNGQARYNALAEALELGLVSISATFAQGNNVFTSTDTLDDLKPFLTVTGSYVNGNTEVVQEYVLSGNLNTATSVITVTCGQLTTTFNVSVAQLPAGYTKKNYVSANGSQYVNSGIYETDMEGKRVRYKESISELVDKAGHVLSSTNYYTPYGRYFPNWNGRKLSYNLFGSQNTSFDLSAQLWQWQQNVPFVIDADNETGKTYVDGKHVLTIVRGTTISASNQLVFFRAGNNQGTQYYFRGNLYYYKIFDRTTGAKVHEYIPCISPSNVVGLYDLVSGVFHAPVAGTLSAG